MSSHEKQRELSKQWLSDSLMELMKTKPYSEITVSEIAARADLSRRTFYRAFASKDEIINHIGQRLVREYLKEITAPVPLDMKSMALVFFGFFDKHREFLLTLRRNHMESFILESFNRYLPYIRSQACRDKISDDPRVNQIFALMSGGAFFNLLMDWLENDSDLTAEELSDLVNKSAKIFLKYNIQ